MGKKEVNISGILNYFKEVIERDHLSNYFYVDSTILSNNINKNILIIIDKSLWIKIVEDKILDMKELDLNNQYELNKLYSYGKDLENNWIELPNDDLYNGKIIDIKINNNEYDIQISKELLPVKLKKSEYNNLSYQIFYDDKILAIKKKFTFDIEDGNFTLIRLYQII